MLVSNAISISMDGRWRAYDNIFIERFWRTLKYEWLYLNSYDSIRELKVGLPPYLEFYNSKRIHQSLGYKTQDEVYWHSVSTGGKTGGAALPVSSGYLNPAVAAGSFVLCKIQPKNQMFLSLTWDTLQFQQDFLPNLISRKLMISNKNDSNLFEIFKWILDN